MRLGKERKIIRTVSSYFPNLLLRQISAGKSFDPSRVTSLSGGLLQADASGFTRMSEQLSHMGRKGAEELTGIFNRFFSSVLKIIFANGGDVLKFGGDSLFVFFKGKRGAYRAAATALQMQKQMKGFRCIPTSCGTFSLALHVGISAGEFSALSLGDSAFKLELTILGQSIGATIRCNEAASPGEILLTEECYRALQGEIRTWEKVRGFYKLVDLKRGPKSDLRPLQTRFEVKDEEEFLRSLLRYLPQGIYEKMKAESNRSFLESEHRRITILFLNLLYSDKLLHDVATKAGGASAVLNDHFKAVQKVVADCGGVITRIDPYSEGDKVLVLFGAPVAQEDDEERAILCALKVKERFESLAASSPYSMEQRIGINTGNSFCGEVGSSDRREYTVMGKDVNLAARLMSKARLGEVLVGDQTFKAVSSKFRASQVTIKAKGIRDPVTAHRVEDLLRPQAVLAREREGRAKSAPMIGREKEIDQINGIIEKVVKCQGHVLSIVGEPGIGKSLLTEKLLDLCLEKGMKGLLVDCHFYGSNTPLLPWIEVFKDHCRIAEADDSPTRVRKLTHALREIDSARWAPLFNDLLGTSVPENEWTKSLDGKTRKQILFDALVRLTLERTKRAATYLIFDDVHWMDQSSLELFLQLSRQLSKHPLLLALVYRRELEVKELDGTENHDRISLGELKKEDALSLASAHLEIAGLPEEVGKLVWEKSRGNPLYLQELIHSLRDSGHLVFNHQEKRWELSSRPEEIEIPDSVQNVIMARIDKLDEIGRKVIKTASVIGRVFSFDTLASVLPFDLAEGELREWLGYLDRLDLVPVKETESSLQYVFRHALTQEVAYGLLPFAQKGNLHLKIGDHYEKKFKDSLEEKCELLAHHYENSPNLNKAFAYLIKAGNKGKRGYSNQEAIRFFDRAEEIYRQDLSAGGHKGQIKGAPELMCRLFEQRGQVYKLIGDYDKGEKDLLAMLDLSRRDNNEINHARALNYLGELHWLRGDYASSQSYVEQAHRISLSLKDDLSLAMSYSNFGDIYRRQGAFEKASESYRFSLRYYKRVKHSEGIAQAYNNIGISSWSLGALSQAARYFESALRVREHAGDKLGEAKTRNNLALIYQDRGNLEDSLEMLKSALEIFRQMGDKRNSGYCLGNMGTIYRSRAEFSESMKAFEDSVKIFSEIGDQHALTYTIGNIGDVQLKTGDLKEARTRYEATLSSARELGDEELESETLSRLGEYHLQSGDIEKSEKHFHQALALAEKIKSNEFTMKALSGLAELQLVSERQHEALKNSDKLLRMAQEENMRQYVATAHLLHGAAKASISPSHEGESDLKEALKISDEVGFREVAYKARLELGELYRRLGDLEGPRRLALSEDQLRHARRIIEEIASHIQQPDLRRKFLNCRLARVGESRERSVGRKSGS